MKPELKAFIEDATRFFRRMGFSLPKALAIIFLLIIVVAAIMGGITYVAILLLVRATIEVASTASGANIAPWAPNAFAWVGGIGMFFLMTVGIPLMIDELRGWLNKFLLIVLATGVLGGVYKIMTPVVASHAVAAACLASLLICVWAYTIAHLLGYGDSLKILGGWLPIGFGLLVFISLIADSCHKKNDPPPAPAEKTVVELTAAHPEEWVELQPWQASLPVIAPGSKAFDVVQPEDSDSCLAKVVVNEKGPQRAICPWPGNIRTAGYVGSQERVRSYQVIAGAKPVKVLMKSQWY